MEYEVMHKPANHRFEVEYEGYIAYLEYRIKGEEAEKMGNVDEKLVKSVMFEILHLERKNLRTKALTDQKMSEEIGKIISENLKLSK